MDIWLQLESGFGRPGLSTEAESGHSVVIGPGDIPVLQAGLSTISSYRRWWREGIRSGGRRHRLVLEAGSGPLGCNRSRYLTSFGGGAERRLFQSVVAVWLRGAAGWRRDLEGADDSKVWGAVVSEARSAQSDGLCLTCMVTQYMLSHHCDSAHRETVGCADLFWASHGLIFWMVFHWFKNPINRDDYSKKLMTTFFRNVTRRY
jgi:hypothetical protein